jgi:secreted protein with Ig-like and vWFA domain
MGRRRKAPKKSHSIMVLDRSGSMSSIKEDTEGGFNEFIKSLRETDNTFVTLVQFDTRYDTVYEQKPVADVPKLSLRPRGGTALRDGVGEAIRRAEKFVRPGDNVVVTILTDGGENSSREYSQEAITRLMDEKREDGWEFNFIGAGVHAWGGAQMLGIAHSHTINYSGAGDDTHDVFAAAAMSNIAKTRGLTSSYTESAPLLKAQLEAGHQPDVQINIGAAPRRRGSGKNLK